MREFETEVPAYVNTFFETRVKDLFDLARRVDEAFSAAGIDYRVVGGLAAYLYVEQVEPDAGRLTKDIDIAVRRSDLPRIAAAVAPLGWEYRHTFGVDMLVQADAPSARRAVHMVFTGERVREDYLEATPELGEARVLQGVRLISLESLIRMKLTSFRAKDEAHINDLDEAGLITREIEDSLAPELLERLQQARERARG
jgi:hypothetical protein